MQIPVLQWALLILGYGVTLAVVGLLFRARLFRTFPFYVTYRIWGLLRTAAVMAVGTYFGYRTNAYASTYWVLAVIGWGPLFLVILEFYDKTLQSYPGLRRFFRVAILCGAGVTTALIAASLVAPRVVDLPDQWANNWFWTLQRSVRFAGAGLVITLVVLIRWFRLPVSRLLQCLVLVSLVINTVEFASGALRSQLSSRADGFLAFALPFFYLGMYCIVLRAVWKWGAEKQRQPAPVAVTDDRREAVLNQLESIMSAIR
jgi:hypothetical protein